MGESCLLLAEESVGKNAEKVSHELGARESSISTAAACVCVRSKNSPCTVQHTLLYSDDSSVITNDTTISAPVGCQPYVYVLKRRTFNVFIFSELPQRIYFFTLLPGLINNAC